MNIYDQFKEETPDKDPIFCYTFALQAQEVANMYKIKKDYMSYAVSEMNVVYTKLPNMNSYDQQMAACERIACDLENKVIKYLKRGK